MPRSKEFEPAVALDRALGIFWAQGYEGTSMQDLVDGMEISRASLYDTFGDKQQLFLAAVKRYGDAVGERLAVLETPGCAVGNVEAFFDGLFDTATSGEGWRGCFAVNATVERAPWCTESAELLSEMRGRMEDAFHRTLKRARREGVLAGDHPPRKLARYLVAVAQGFGVVARTRPDRRVLRDVLDVGLSVLR